MAEVQKSTTSGEVAQIFIEFVLMQAQNAALFLGHIPSPQSGKPEVNLGLARMFIDQLAMIREKTRGNLSKEEQEVLNNAISNLQLAFVEASKPGASAPEQQPAAPKAENPPAAPPPAPAGEGGEEPKKKFTKSYGG
jgi:hypothetical protein